MKRFHLYVVLALAVLLTVAANSWHRSHSVANTTVSTDTLADIQTPTNSEKSMPSDNKAGKNSSEVTKPPVDRLAQMGITPDMTQSQKEEKYMQWYAAESAKIAVEHQHPVEFYGETVDESNQPVADATADLVLTESPATPNGIVETNLQSDTQGLFYFGGAIGKMLQVSVYKKGYNSTKNSRINFDYADYQPNPNKPEVFHLRKKGAGADLISAVLNVQGPRDGTPVGVDFLNKSFGGSGPMQMSQTKPPYESWKEATEWSFRMTIPDGGFVEENDEFPFEAPVNGYQPTIDFDFKVDQPDWKTSFTKSYYIVFGNPPCYGNLTVQTDIMWGGARITYAINPNGSRYLEPKDQTYVRPQ